MPVVIIPKFSPSENMSDEDQSLPSRTAIPLIVNVSASNIISSHCFLGAHLKYKELWNKPITHIFLRKIQNTQALHCFTPKSAHNLLSTHIGVTDPTGLGRIEIRLVSVDVAPNRAAVAVADLEEAAVGVQVQIFAVADEAPAVEDQIAHFVGQF